MFYLYSNPLCLEQKLHNFLAKSIEFVAASIGIIWRSESRIFRIWRYFITFLLFSFNTVTTFTTSPNSTNTHWDFLRVLLRQATLTSYSILIIEILVMMLIQKKKILKCFRYGEKLYQMRQQFPKANNTGAQSVFHTFLITIGIDILIIIILIVLVTVTFLMKPTIFSFISAIVTPITFVVRFCIFVLYYVSLAFSLICLQTIHEGFKGGVTHDILMLNQMVNKFIKKIHKTLEVTLLFLMWETFVGFVTHVRCSSYS